MRFNIISNLINGVGLQQDYLLLKEALKKRGHAVHGVQFNQKPLVIPKADINIFLEVVTPLAFQAAQKQWIVPNPEWWFVTWDVFQWDMVLAKTRDCQRIFTKKVGETCQYLGWIARDMYRPEIPRERKFLHVAGKSQFKNTAAVVHGCQHARVGVTVIGEHAKGVRWRVEEPELVRLMNSHFCHVMPSAYEGYGHVLHEALACGQIIITTDAPPMNEITPALLVPSVGSTPYHAGLLHKVEPLAIAHAVRDVLALSDEEIHRYREEARAQYLLEKQQFEEALDALVGRPI